MTHRFQVLSPPTMMVGSTVFHYKRMVRSDFDFVFIPSLKAHTPVLILQTYGHHQTPFRADGRYDPAL